jgi:hypothetical protein
MNIIVILPNEAETFRLGHMVDGDLFKESAGDGGLARAEHVYLEANLDLLGERPLREHRLHLQHERARVRHRYPSLNVTS